MDRTPTQTLELPLDRDEEHPRRLLQVGNRVIAYGGDEGTLAVIERTSSGSSSSNTKIESSVRAFRRFDDDCVRAIGISQDGKRVVLGSDSGMVQIYCYDDLDTSNAVHPFVGNSPDFKQDSQDDEDDMFMSQSDALQGVYSGEKVFAGPCCDAPVRDIQFLPHTHLAIIATENNLTIVNVESSDSIAENTQTLPTDGGIGVRGVSFTTTSNYDDHTFILSALDMNGRLTHYQATMDESNTKVLSHKVLDKESRLVVEKRDVGELLGATPACRSSRPVWLRSNKKQAFLAVGGQTYMQLRMMQENSTLELTEQDQPLSTVNKETGGVLGHLDLIVLFEALGDDYIVSAGRDKRLVLWHMETRKDGSLVANFVRTLGEDCDAVPTDLLWFNDSETKSECLYVATADAKLVAIEGRSSIVPKSIQSGTSSGAMEASSQQGNDGDASAVDKVTTTSTQADMNDADDDDKSGIFKSPSKDSNGSPASRNRFIDDEADDGGDDYDDESVAGPTIRHTQAVDSPANDSSGGHDDDDDGSEGDAYDIDHYRLSNQRPSMQQPVMKLPDPQPAFAPSSTPLGMARRFMCWNHIGAVTHIQGVPGVSRSSIDIDFTDTLTRRPVNFTDNIGFILGSLGEDGAIFATDLAEDDEDDDDDNLNDVIDGLHMSETTRAALKKSQQKRMKKDGSKATGSTIFFHRFDTFAAIREKDWYLALPDGERALGCACGEGWAAVVTSRRFLRLFSSGGNQGQVIWLTGEAVSMVGRGRFLAVFYHEAPPLMDETQKLGFLLFDAVSNRTVYKGSTSCISSGSSLAWAGFTNEFSLVAMDSDGMLSMVASSGADESRSGLSWEWFPVLDTVGLRKSIDDSFWPITVYDGKLVCVPLKGGVKHPDATRRPVTTTLGLRLPLARGTLPAVNALEELSVRAALAFQQKKVVNMIQGDEEDAEVENEMRTISAQLDKVTLKMFAAMVEAGKLERALDLVDRLHLEKSFDLAMKIGDHHRKLVDLIDEAKERRFGGQDDLDEEEEEDDDRFGGDDSFKATRESDRPRITPDAASGRKTKRAFDDIHAADLSHRNIRNRSAFA